MENGFRVGWSKVTIQGSDFGGQEKDFDAVCSKIEDELLEAASENPRLFEEGSIQGMADSVCRETLKALGWEKPDVPFVSVSWMNDTKVNGKEF